jgi:predicted transcriptional regulator
LPFRRNHFVHAHRQDKHLAIPSELAIAELSSIRDRLLNPPKLIPMFQMDVATCTPADAIGIPTKQMLEGNFSQLPVYDGGVLIGLLTAETVARWLASRLGGGDGILEEETVGQVMPYQEAEPNHTLMRRDATVFEAMDAFKKFTREGRSLDAIIVTTNGKKTEKPLGIVTIADMPELLRAAHI